MAAKKKVTKKKARGQTAAIPLPPAADWRTTDEEEILKRVQRGREEEFKISNTKPTHPIFSDFTVNSVSGLSYMVEIRNLAKRQFSCSCPDFRSNGLGTCKHVEATLIWLKKRQKGVFKLAEINGSYRMDLVVEDNHIRLLGPGPIPKSVRSLFDGSRKLSSEQSVEAALASLRKKAPEIRISQEVEPWLEGRQRAEERVLLRREYEVGIASGMYPEHVTTFPLYPYQREGMLHLAFKERALLADEMGLGKTIQAIAACALIHSLGKAQRVLVVTPASLKTEWEEQIRKFTLLDQQLVFGSRTARAAIYRQPNPPFFTIVNYEQIVADSLDINEHFKPDIVVLDEAQRIKNWSTKTAQAVKRLQSRYAFVLTGTPIENRIDEVYSIVDFLDRSILGPLFRFNREFYQLDERGRPSDYKNLPMLRERIAPVMLRRRKAQVETELPDRTDRNLFVKLTPAMQADYDQYKQEVSKLLLISQRRALTKREQEILMVMLNMMRMICDSPSVVKKLECRDCPKLAELESILDDCLTDPDVKVIIFSEWEGMLTRVKELAEKNGTGYAWHTGSVPPKRRRGEIMAFRNDPLCRLFLSTDSGSVGLNLQNASVVINCDLPWNPAKLEQRIARAWRKHQRRAVTVVNLVAEKTIEHSMLDTLAMKSLLSDGVLDGTEDGLQNARMKRGADSHLAKLRQIILEVPAAATPVAKAPQPVDPALHFAQQAKGRLGNQLVDCHESYVVGNPTPVLVAVVANSALNQLPIMEQLFAENPWQHQKPTLQVVDAATWEAIQKLRDAGFLTLNTRATRPLNTGSNEAPAFTAEQLQQMERLKSQVAKKLKVAQFLIDEEMPDDSLAHLKSATLHLAQAFAIQHHLSTPEALEETCTPAYGPLWNEHLAAVKEFVENPESVNASVYLAFLGGLA